MSREMWKDINGFEGYYKISNYGNVKSLDRLVKSKAGSLKFLKGNIKKCAISSVYRLALLSKENKEIGISVHKLVALHFIPNPLRKPEINHMDGNKLNNYFGNLEWCTRSENIQHSYDIGLQISRKGSKHHMAKITEDDVAEMFHLSWQGKTTKPS